MFEWLLEYAGFHCYIGDGALGESAPITKPKIPTAAAMMIATDARLSPVKVLLKSCVLVAFPCTPRFMVLATVCSCPAKIKVTRMTTTRAAMPMTSPIRMVL